MALGCLLVQVPTLRLPIGALPPTSRPQWVNLKNSNATILACLDSPTLANRPILADGGGRSEWTHQAAKTEPAAKPDKYLGDSGGAVSKGDLRRRGRYTAS